MNEGRARRTLDPSGRVRPVAWAGILFMAAAMPAAGQVAYDGRAPGAFTAGIPVPYGFIQPRETLGFSPSYVISTNPYAPGVGVQYRCQYPDGWNVTDFSRDVNGIPNGVEHLCRAAARPPLR